jgi:hypothetical protein
MQSLNDFPASDVAALRSGSICARRTSSDKLKLGFAKAEA